MMGSLTSQRRPAPRNLAMFRAWLGQLARQSLAILIFGLVVLAPVEAYAAVRNVTVTPPAPAGGLEGFAVYFTENGAPVYVIVDIPPNSSVAQKRSLIINAMNAKGIAALPGAAPGQIDVNFVHQIFRQSGTGEVGDGIFSDGPAVSMYGLVTAPGQTGPLGQTRDGIQGSSFDLLFSGPGFLAQAQVNSGALALGFGIDQVLSALFQDLLGDLPNFLKPGLELDLIQDTITFDPVGLGLPKDQQT